MRCPAPGISQPTIGATIAIFVSGYSGVLAVAAFSVDVLAIQMICHSDRHDLALDFTSDFRAAGADQHVDFAAYSELRQINPGLDREAGIGQDAALVVDLEVVHIGAVSVNFGADRMARAMNKVVA